MDNKNNTEISLNEGGGIEIPHGWSLVELSEICQKAAIVQRKTVKPDDDFLYLDIGAIDNEKNRIISHKVYKWKEAPSRAQQIVCLNDILFSTVRTYLKNIAQIESKLYEGQIASSGFTIIRANREASHSKYLFFFTTSRNFLESLNKLQTGTSYPAVRDKDVFSQKIPLPPLGEQKRIVAKIEELFSRLDAGIESLKKAQAQLKTYRQAVLKWAFEGRLTNDKIIDGQLPEGWVWETTSNILGFVTSGSRGWAKYYSEKGAIFLRMGNLDHETITLDLSDIQRVALPSSAEGLRTRVQEGDILISITADVGMIGLVPENFPEAYINQHVALARPDAKRVLPKFLAIYLSGKENGQKQLKEMQRGATKVGLGLDDIRSVKFPLPPLSEQAFIIAEIETRLSVCDKLEESIEQSLKQAEALRQSILKKAFEGKLVPQDPNDEPASILLERIKADREKAAPVAAKNATHARKNHNSADHFYQHSTVFRASAFTPPNHQYGNYAYCLLAKNKL